MASNCSEQTLCPWDGDPGEPIFQVKENDSTYYDATVDRQCRVPIRSLEEVKEELQQKYGGN